MEVPPGPCPPSPSSAPPASLTQNCDSETALVEGERKRGMYFVRGADEGSPFDFQPQMFSIREKEFRDEHVCLRLLLYCRPNLTLYQPEFYKSCSIMRPSQTQNNDVVIFSDTITGHLGGTAKAKATKGTKHRKELEFIRLLREAERAALDGNAPTHHEDSTGIIQGGRTNLPLFPSLGHVEEELSMSSGDPSPPYLKHGLPPISFWFPEEGSGPDAPIPPPTSSLPQSLSLLALRCPVLTDQVSGSQHQAYDQRHYCCQTCCKLHAWRTSSFR